MGTSASFALARKIAACLSAALLSSTLMPASALAGEDDNAADSSVGKAQEVSASQDEIESDAGSLLASGLIGSPSSFVRADVALDSEPIVGSFTIDGLTFAAVDGSTVELVGVAEMAGFESGGSTLSLPSSVTYASFDYALASIGAYAFYLSGVASVDLPASVVDVDDRAFRSSDVASVTVAEGNLSYSSFDGALYDADRSSLLLIPEGKQGAVLLPKETEVAEAGKFSHCSLVDAIFAEDGAAFASENGLLYDASLTTLLRVPAGATDITIREGCTAIAAGAMEGCAKLVTINAPASVTSISPDVFTSVPTVSLPVATLAEGAPQLTALVALSATDDDLPEVDSAAITVWTTEDEMWGLWGAVGVSVRVSDGPDAAIEEAAVYGAGARVNMFVSSDETPYYIDSSGQFTAWKYSNKWVLTTASYYEYCFNGGVFYYTNQYRTLEIFKNKNKEGFGYLRIGTSLDEPFEQVHSSAEFSSISQSVYFVLYNNASVRLTFDTGGSTSLAPFSALPAKAKPTKTGYVFGGYYTEENGGGTQYYDSNCNAIRIYDSVEDMTLYAKWTAASLCTVTFDKKGGDGGTSSKSVYVGSNVGTIAPPTLDGWSFSGYTDDFGTSTYQFVKADGTPTTRTVSGGRTLYANWTKELSFDANGGESGSLRSLTLCKDRDIGQVCSQVASTNSDYPIRSMFASPIKVDEGWAPVRAGYAFSGFYDIDSPNGGTCYIDAEGNLKVPKPYPTSMTSALYARWTPNPYTIAFDPNYAGASGALQELQATYDSDVMLPYPIPRNGYVFCNWNTKADGTGTAYGTEGYLRKPNLATSGTVTLYAQWAPAISADVPLEVAAKVDLLGIEQQQEAQGYIESRCGEPLTVASIELTPLAGATDLFGAGNVADVALEVMLDGFATPSARFTLDASASQAPAAPAAFRMASYGDRVPISYRFDISDTLLSNLVETTKAVCSVAYTVELAS